MPAKNDGRNNKRNQGGKKRRVPTHDQQEDNDGMEHPPLFLRVRAPGEQEIENETYAVIGQELTVSVKGFETDEANSRLAAVLHLASLPGDVVVSNRMVGVRIADPPGQVIVRPGLDMRRTVVTLVELPEDSADDVNLDVYLGMGDSLQCTLEVFKHPDGTDLPSKILTLYMVGVGFKTGWDMDSSKPPTLFARMKAIIVTMPSTAARSK